MQKRTFLAAATLTALLLSMGPLQPSAIGATADPAAHSLQLTEDATGPHWAYVWGFNGAEGLAFGITAAFMCSAFTGPGGFACGVTGAL